MISSVPFLLIEHPMTYLYTTMHYYEINLSEKPHLKKKLTFTVIGKLISL